MFVNDKIKKRFINNFKVLINILQQELNNLKIILNDISYFPIFPILLLIAITLVMFLPQNVQDSLRLHYHNPQWWELLTNAFVHSDWSHYWSNVSILIILVVLQLILVTLIKENKRYYIALLATIFIVPILSAIIELYYTWTGMTFYSKMLTSCGSSGIVFALFGFIPVISLAYFSKLINKNMINRFSIIPFTAILSYVLIGFLVTSYFFTHSASIAIISIFFIAIFIGLLILTLIFQRVDYIKALKESFSTPKHPVSSFAWIMLILLFLILPWQILPNVFVVNGNFINFIAHFIGFMFGIIICYIAFNLNI